jgi:ribosomal protein S18 acetylase RimI-like enzyme
MESLIRSARSADAEQIACVLAECFHPSSGLGSLLQPWILASLHNELERRLARQPAYHSCLIALIDDVVVGTVEVAVRPLPEPWWLPSFVHRDRLVYVSNLAVRPSWRRRGIARDLLSESERTAQHWHQPDIRLHVMADNAAALQLYRSLGYSIENSEREFPFIGARKHLLFKNLPTAVLEDNKKAGE